MKKALLIGVLILIVFLVTGYLYQIQLGAIPFILFSIILLFGAKKFGRMFTSSFPVKIKRL